MPRDRDADLTTAQLADRTGVSAGTLRVWESRHGFPSPARLPGGHRRYTGDDVEAVRTVARLRSQGLSMPAAIERALREARPVAASIFSGLRRAHPDLQPATLAKPAVLAITHAIEDEYCAGSAGGLLFGCFQRERFYRDAERRWRDVARAAELAVAMADFDRLREPQGEPVQAPIESSLPLAREWTLVVDAPGVQACLAAWELPSENERSERTRRFEVMWSFEPTVVRSASHVAIEALRLSAPSVARRARAALGEPPEPSGPELRSASAISHRVVAYLGETYEARARAR